jgi:hypothetical protein
MASDVAVEGRDHESLLPVKLTLDRLSGPAKKNDELSNSQAAREQETYNSDLAPLCV